MLLFLVEQLCFEQRWLCRTTEKKKKEYAADSQWAITFSSIALLGESFIVWSFTAGKNNGCARFFNATESSILVTVSLWCLRSPLNLSLLLIAGQFALTQVTGYLYLTSKALLGSC